VSPVAHKPSLGKMGIDTKGIVNVGAFTSGQKRFCIASECRVAEGDAVTSYPDPVTLNTRG
jgi:hypothetical protein